jgi:predicted lipoprotein
MKKKIILIVVVVIVFGFILYKSIYIENLSDKRKKDNVQSFGILSEQVDLFRKNAIPALIKNAFPLTEWTGKINTDTQFLIEKYGRSKGIGPFYFFIIKGEAILTGVSEEELIFDAGNNISGAIQIKYIFSNAVRDVSGFFNIDDYENTMDYNTISSEINQSILSEVIDEKIKLLQTGDSIFFYGVIEINKKELPVNHLEIIPLKIESNE